MNSANKNVSGTHPLKESESSILFRWIWEGYNSDAKLNSWNLDTLGKSLEGKDFIQVENLLNKLCDGIARCISLSQKVSSNLGSMEIQKRKALDTTFDSSRINSVKRKKGDNIPESKIVIEDCRVFPETNTDLQDGLKLKTYHTRIFRILASLSSILYKLQGESESKPRNSFFKLHSESSVNIGKSLGLILGNSANMNWNSEKNIEIAAKTAWRLLSPVAELKLEDLFLFNRHKSAPIVINPKETLYNIFLIPSDSFLKNNYATGKSSAADKPHILSSFTNRVHQIINILSETKKSNIKISIVQIILLFDSAVYNKYTQIALNFKSNISQSLIPDELNYLVLSLITIVTNGTQEMDKFVEFTPEAREKSTNKKPRTEQKPGNRVESDLAKDKTQVERKIIHLSLWQKLTYSSLSCANDLFERVVVSLGNKVPLFTDLAQFLAISGELNFSNLVKLLFSFSAYLNRFSYYLISTLIETKDEAKSGLGYNQFRFANDVDKPKIVKFNGPITLPSSNRQKYTAFENSDVSEGNLQLQKIPKNTEQIFLSSYKDFLNSHSIHNKLSSTFKFELDESIFNLESMSKTNTSPYLASVKSFKYSLSAAINMGDIFNKCFDSLYLPVLLPVNILHEELHRVGQLILSVLNKNIISCIWALDEEEIYQHSKAKMLATNSSLDHPELDKLRGISSNQQNSSGFGGSALKIHSDEVIKAALLTKQLSLFTLLLSTIKSWLFFKSKAEVLISKTTNSTDIDQSYKQHKFQDQISKHLSGLRESIFNGKNDKVSGRLGFTVLVDMMWISSNILCDGNMSLKCDKNSPDYNNLRASAFNLLKLCYSLVNFWPETFVSICAFEIQPEDTERDVNSYKCKSLDAIVSGKIRRWAQIFDMSCRHAKTKMELEGFSPGIGYGILSKNYESRTNLSPTRLVSSEKEEIFDQALYFGIFGCLRWLKVVSSVSQQHLTLPAEWEWSHLQRMPRIVGREALEDTLIKIAELGLSEAVFFGIYNIVKLETPSTQNIQNLTNCDTNEFSFLEICLYTINHRISKLKPGSKKQKQAHLQPSDPKNGQQEESMEFVENKHSLIVDNASEQKENTETLVQASPVLLILDSWSLVAIRTIASLLGANLNLKGVQGKASKENNQIEAEIMGKLGDLEFGSLKGEEIAKSILNKNNRTKSDSNSRIFSFKPRSYLLTQSFASIGLSRQVIRPKTFAKVVLSLKHLAELRSSKKISKKSMRTVQRTLLDRAYTWLGISERIVAHSSLRSRFDSSISPGASAPLTDDQILPLSYAPKSNQLEKEIKNHENQFAQWWICTLSVAVDQVISATQKNNEFYNHLSNQKSEDSANPGYYQLFAIKFDLPSVHALELHFDNSKSIILSLTAINTFLSFLTFLQFDHSALVSLVSCQIPSTYLTTDDHLEKDTTSYTKNEILELISSSISKQSTLVSPRIPRKSSFRDNSGSDPIKKTLSDNRIYSHSACMLLLNIILRFPHSGLPDMICDLFDSDTIIHNNPHLILKLNSDSDDFKLDNFTIQLISEYSNSLEIWDSIFKKSAAFLQKLYILYHSIHSVSLGLTFVAWAGISYTNLVSSAYRQSHNNLHSNPTNSIQSKYNNSYEFIQKVPLNAGSSLSTPESIEEKTTPCNQSSNVSSGIRTIDSRKDQIPALNLEPFEKFRIMWSQLEDSINSIFLKDKELLKRHKSNIFDEKKHEIILTSLQLLKSLLRTWKNQTHELLSLINSLFKESNSKLGNRLAEINTVKMIDSGIISTLLNITVPVFLKRPVSLRPTGIYLGSEMNTFFTGSNVYIKSISSEFCNSFLMGFNDIVYDLERYTKKEADIRDKILVSSILFTLPELYHDSKTKKAENNDHYFNTASDTLYNNACEYKTPKPLVSIYQDLNPNAQIQFIDSLQKYIVKSTNAYMYLFRGFFREPSISQIDARLRNQERVYFTQEPFNEGAVALNPGFDNLSFSTTELPLLVSTMIYLRNMDQFQKSLAGCIKYLLYMLYSERVNVQNYIGLSIPKRNIVITFPDDLEHHQDGRIPTLVFKDHGLLCSLSPFFKSLVSGGFYESDAVLANREKFPEICNSFPFLAGLECNFIKLHSTRIFEFLGLIRLVYILLRMDFRESYKANYIILHEVNSVCIGSFAAVSSNDTSSFKQLGGCQFIKGGAKENSYGYTSAQDNDHTHSIDTGHNETANELIDFCSCNRICIMSFQPDDWVSFFEISSRFLASALCNLCSIHLLNLLDPKSNFFHSNKALPINLQTRKFTNGNIFLIDELDKSISSQCEASSYEKNPKTEYRVLKHMENSQKYPFYLQNWDGIFDVAWIPRFYSIIVSLTSWDINQYLESPLCGVSDSISDTEPKNDLEFGQHFPFYYHYPLDTERISESNILSEKQLENIAIIELWSDRRGLKKSNLSKKNSADYEKNSKPSSPDTKDNFNINPNIEQIKDLYINNAKKRVGSNSQLTSLRIILATNGLMKYAPAIEYQLLKKSHFNILHLSSNHGYSPNLPDSNKNPQEFIGVNSGDANQNEAILDDKPSDSDDSEILYKQIDKLGFSSDDWSCFKSDISHALKTSWVFNS